MPSILSGAVYAVGFRGRAARAVAGMWVLAIGLEGALYFVSTSWLPVLAHGVVAAFVILVAGLLLREVLGGDFVDLNTILGGICGYLLLGYVFVNLFAIVELLVPGSFLDGGQPLPGAERLGNPHPLVYYSFVTLSTLGYGDVTPIGGFARSLSIVEALLGQLYLAILVASLVGMQLAQRVRSRD